MFAKRMVQASGFTTIILAVALLALIILMAVALYPDLYQLTIYHPCSGPMCELQRPTQGIIPLVCALGAYFVTLVAILFVYGTRILRLDRKDTLFYLLASLIIDFVLMIAFKNSNLGGRIDRFFFYASIIHAVLLIAGAISLYFHSKNSATMEYKPSMKLWLKSVTIIFIVFTPIVLIFLAQTY